MANPGRFVSSVLLALGVAFVLLGFNTALGFTTGGLVASVAAVATLLYAGGIWLGPRSAPRPASPPATLSLIVFDRNGLVVSGPAIGRPVTALFPEIMRPTIERHSSAALAGASARFPCVLDGRPLLVDTLPVRSVDGVVVYGILLTAESAASVAHA